MRLLAGDEGPNVPTVFPFRNHCISSVLNHTDLMASPSAIQSSDRFPPHSGPSSGLLLGEIRLTAAKLRRNSSSSRPPLSRFALIRTLRTVTYQRPFQQASYLLPQRDDFQYQERFGQVTRLKGPFWVSFQSTRIVSWRETDACVCSKIVWLLNDSYQAFYCALSTACLNGTLRGSSTRSIGGQEILWMCDAKPLLPTLRGQAERVCPVSALFYISWAY